MHPEHQRYFKFTSKSRLSKAIATLAGMVEGISIDSEITAAEVSHLEEWVEQHACICNVHPFNELLPVVKEALRDGVLTTGEKADILWLCDNLTSDAFYDQVTIGTQRLHGILHGIIADGKITEEELRGLTTWISEHDHLKTCWPYDEIDSIVTAVLADGKIGEDEYKALLSLFVDFSQIEDDVTITRPKILVKGTIAGLCAICPEITFQEATFCFTGASARYKRDDLKLLVEKHGGRFTNNVTQSLDYLIIGANGNPCWTYACYGRKVEVAVKLRKQGHKILLVHENDFHDAIAEIVG